ncbi:uncharacterized protein LOC109835053 [Asparagus officinalis]|uniref:uncharacterized protein LOC109835053 n=1 Tax=Asparagus officinalis TaxID=4686 RepID=UPI00098E6934|nr:uncharacterized protein LOC109835053 [Asparagus officinalis]
MRKLWNARVDISLSSSSIGIDPDPNPSSASSTASRTQSIRRRLRHRLRHGIASSAEVTASAQHRLSLQRPSHRLSFDRVTLAYCCTSQVQYSDLAEVDRASILEKFRQSTSEWSQNINVLPGDCTESGNGDHNCAMIVVTDACLPSVVPGEAPVSAHILINYELPTKKVFFDLLHSFPYMRSFLLHKNGENGRIVIVVDCRWKCHQHGCWRRSGDPRRNRGE